MAKKIISYKPIKGKRQKELRVVRDPVLNIGTENSNTQERGISFTGRPPDYKSVEELEKKISQYFKDGFRIKKVYSPKLEMEVEIPYITITGLVLYLGFCDRKAFYDYEKKKAFSHAIKKARTFIEMEYEEMLKHGNAAGAIFALKNFNWTDTQEIKHSGQIEHNANITELTTAELKALAKENM